MSREEHADLLDLLHKLPIETCDYQEWVNVGMALKKEGFSVDDWKSWSATDTRTDKRGKPYYSAFQCDSKWKGFDNNHMDGVSSGTIIHLLETKTGWVQPSQRTYGWDDSVQTSDEPGYTSVCFLYLIKQHDAVWFAAHGLCQFAALLVSYISRRCTH